VQRRLAVSSQSPFGYVPAPIRIQVRCETMETLLQIKGLRTYFYGRNKNPVKAVDGVSYDVQAGEIVAIVGESGCGKTVSTLSLVRLNPPTSTIVGGEALWRGEDLLKMSQDKIRHVRGKEIAIVFQNPLSSLNPLMTIGKQISEVLKIHFGMSDRESWNESQHSLGLVQVPDVKSKMEAYPFQLSGGMRQRVMVAMALCCKPGLIIADEPTTALDATTQAQILELISSTNKAAGRALIIVTHDLGIVARYADKINIMYAGHVVESADCMELYKMPIHPYAEALLRAVPRLDQTGEYKLIPIDGQPPRLDRLGPGCPFEPRCSHRIKRCKEEMPALKEAFPDHLAACWQCEAR
jgi:oligopeptide/dipeptide ABC transporter ATP-binding protein